MFSKFIAKLVVGAVIIAGGAILPTGSASATSGDCTGIYIGDTGARSYTVTAIVCTGTRKIRAVLVWASSGASANEYTNYGKYAGTGGVSHARTTSGVYIRGYWQKN